MTVFTGSAIQVPENPGPLSIPLKGLADALRVRGVSVAPFLRVEMGARIGHPGAHQFACTGEEDFPEIASKIAELGKVVRFIEMFVPSGGVFCVQTHRYMDILARYLAAYEPCNDVQYGRWDVLVEPLNAA